jgi:hypothetical protein
MIPKVLGRWTLERLPPPQPALNFGHVHVIIVAFAVGYYVPDIATYLHEYHDMLYASVHASMV